MEDAMNSPDPTKPADRQSTVYTLAPSDAFKLWQVEAARRECPSRRHLSWVEIGEWVLALVVGGAIGLAFGWSVVGGDGVGLLRLVIL
jgi:hypothetical protein